MRRRTCLGRKSSMSWISASPRSYRRSSSPVRWNTSVDKERAMKVIENAPWWLVSAGIHAVLILGAALVYVERLLAIETDIMVVCPGAVPPLIADPARDFVGEHATPAVDPDPAPELSEPFVFDPTAAIAKKNESANN